MDRQLNYSFILKIIRVKVIDYLTKHKIKGLVIGVSGGLDSGVNCAILAPICKELGIPLIGRYIHIETNKEEEMKRAEHIGRAYCTEYASKDLTELYHYSLSSFEEDEECDMSLISERIRLGNIKARLRMIHLYNIAGKRKSIVIDNDNMTEYLLGFYTIGGDIGDITPMADLYKTEVFKLARYIQSIAETEYEKEALQEIIDAIPTDGLGITSSDVEQFGVANYDAVDDILYNTINTSPLNDKYDSLMQELSKLYGQDGTEKVINRNKNSKFKRNHPYRVRIL